MRSQRSQTKTRSAEASAEGGRILYLSTRKVEEDFARIRPPHWKRAGKAMLQVLGLVTVTVPYVQIKVSAPKEERDEIQKLNAVWKDLLKHDQVGTIDEPKRYFHGRCAMRAMPFTETNPPVLWLAGETESTILGLGGALDHAHLSVDAKASANAKITMFETDVAKTIAETIPIDEAHRRLAVDDEEEWTIDIYEILHYGPQGTQIECEFLAEKERWTQRSYAQRSKSALLGSPLFVAYRHSD
jgi:Family of unknown function (DUF7019)